MARYTGPVCKLCRREGEKLFLKGARCMSPKCSFERRSYAPGQHGKDAQFRRGRGSDYALQLREKQKARRVYGVLERQFRRYFGEALRRPGLTGSNLLSILESRLDNVIFRMGWADSRSHARLLVQHGHFVVNGRRTNIPSYLVVPGDAIAVRDGSRERAYFKELKSYMSDRPVAPEWLEVDSAAMKGTVLRVPERRDIDLPLNEQLIVEYYSR
ncbi:MAG: 30S ribosomal protein S4 [Anaerolineae bacterium]|nr:30S ribosomal protein S4 [Anaerolineae bacterium]MEB2287448.1 30S ribosomal protein S4 [Anaerolineae bacterium]